MVTLQCLVQPRKDGIDSLLPSCGTAWLCVRRTEEVSVRVVNSLVQTDFGLTEE